MILKRYDENRDSLIGGDCPGINATIRGVGKTAIMHYGMEVIGIHSGFIGLLNKDIQVFDENGYLVY